MACGPQGNIGLLIITQYCSEVTGNTVNCSQHHSIEVLSLCDTKNKYRNENWQRECACLKCVNQNTSRQPTEVKRCTMYRSGPYKGVKQDTLLLRYGSARKKICWVAIIAGFTIQLFGVLYRTES